MLKIQIPAAATVVLAGCAGPVPYRIPSPADPADPPLVSVVPNGNSISAAAPILVVSNDSPSHLLVEICPETRADQTVILPWRFILPEDMRKENAVILPHKTISFRIHDRHEFRKGALLGVYRRLTLDEVLSDSEIANSVPPDDISGFLSDAAWFRFEYVHRISKTTLFSPSPVVVIKDTHEAARQEPDDDGWRKPDR